MTAASPRRRRPAPRLVAVAAALAAAGMVAACSSGGGRGRHDLDPDTARFRHGSRSVEVPLTACGREGDVVVLAGTAGGTVLQAEVDVGEGGAERTGVTADLGGESLILGAFGAETSRGPAGEIASVRVDGDTLTVEATWVTLDERLRPETPPSDGVEGSLVARCPEDDDETAAPATDEAAVVVRERGRSASGRAMPRCG